MTRSKSAFIFLKSVIVLLVLCFCAFGQEKAVDLKDRRITIHQQKAPLGDIFNELIDKYDVAIGFEDSTLDNDHTDYYFWTAKPYKLEEITYPNGKYSINLNGKFPIKKYWFTLDVDNQRLEDVLNKLVPQLNNYEWEINDDVVNIFPVKGGDERYQALLETNITKFFFAKDEPIHRMRERVFNLPEVKNYLEKNNLFTSQYRNFMQWRDKKLGIDLTFSDITLRELLNKITKAKRGGWLLKQDMYLSQPGKEIIEIDI